jgi:hypothetical protein
METTYTIEFMRLAEPPSPQIKQPSGFHVALLLRFPRFCGLGCDKGEDSHEQE